MRNASYRPARSVVAIAVIAAGTFVVIAVGAFRRDGASDWSDPRSGTGGYPLVVETMLPLAVDPNSADGRAELGSGLPTTSSSNRSGCCPVTMPAA